MANRKIPSSPSPRQRRLRQAAEEREMDLRRRPPTPRRKGSTPLWKRLRLIAIVLLLIGLGQLATASLTAPQFRVADVSVSGAQISDTEKIREVQDDLTGQNWIRAKTSEASAQLAAIPTVKSARISRALHWPPVLHIAIEERAPFVRVGAGENWWMVDESGVPFRRAEKADENYYALTNPQFAPELGVALPPENWQPAFRLVNTLEGSTPFSGQEGKAWPLRRIHFDKNGFASLRLQGGAHDEMLVRLGGDRWSEKLERTRVALEFFERTNQRATVLNLVSYTMPQWTPLRPAKVENAPPNIALSPDA